jgi:hypothetical protein
MGSLPSTVAAERAEYSVASFRVVVLIGFEVGVGVVDCDGGSVHGWTLWVNASSSHGTSQEMATRHAGLTYGTRWSRVRSRSVCSLRCAGASGLYPRGGGGGRNG